jgi:hypothetical protein
MLKYKPFIDAEGRIKGWFEEMENTNEAKREATGKLKRSSAKEARSLRELSEALSLRIARLRSRSVSVEDFLLNSDETCGSSSNGIPTTSKESSFATRSRRWVRRISLAIRTSLSSWTSGRSGISQNNPVAPGVSVA